MRSPRLVALLLLVAACQGRSMEPPSPEVAPPIGPPHRDFTSGRRLRARVIAGEGSEPLLRAIFDSERGQDCQFLPASDGQLRCLPAVSEPFQDTGLFSDPQGTEARTAGAPRGR